MSYHLAVRNTPSISKAYEAGIQALSADRHYVKVTETHDLNGSVNIDACLRAAQPNASRWDYTFGYRDQSYYVEIHPAGTGEVDTVINKFTWLINWLRTDGARLNAINAANPFHWVASGKVSIPLGSTYHRRIMKAGLTMPKTMLIL